MNWSALIVFIVFFLLVTVMGFWAAKWRQADLNHLNEWGLGGRRFGTLITWFLLGGDLYTAYTFIAVPALMYGKGAVGFYAVPYTIIIYPLVFAMMPRMWSVAKKHGYVTASDFVKDRFDSKTLAFLVAFTGILATMPYIALQLVGMQAVLAAMGLKGDLPIIIAFIILALYTYKSGLRAPAIIAVVKDVMIYITVLAVIIIVPAKLGGFGHIFNVAASVLPTHNPPGSVVIGPAGYVGYATLALGSALALFLYPHSLTGILSSKSREVIKRNSALMPAYSFALGIIALLGFMALAAGIKTTNPSSAIPMLFLKVFPNWFSGFAFAAIAIGALVPAAIMSIAAANLFTRNIYREYFNPNCSPEKESQVAKITSMVVKVGALFFIVFLPSQYAINLQLLGGIWILQTLPAVFIGLYTTWFHRSALIWGWVAGMVCGTLMAVSQNFNSIYPLQIGGHAISAYAAVYAIIINLAVSVVITVLLKVLGIKKGQDKTKTADYHFSGNGYEETIR
jgi:SSS family solute:Na+ symporter